MEIHSADTVCHQVLVIYYRYRDNVQRILFGPGAAHPVHLLSLLALLLSAGSVYTQEWQVYTAANSGLRSDTVTSIAIDNDGIKWFGTPAGLARYDDEDWTIYTTEDSLVHNSINSIAFDSATGEPYLWIGTASGISRGRLAADGLQSIDPINTEPSGIPVNDVRAIIVDSDGLKWFGTGSGIAVYNDTTWRHFDTSTENRLSHNTITSIGHDTRGWRFLGTRGGGVSRLRSRGIDAITGASPYDAIWSGVGSDTVLSAAAFITQDNRAVQWFGTTRGVAYHDTLATKWGWERYNMANSGLSDDTVLVIRRGPDDRIWFGTANGASVWEDGRWYGPPEDGLEGRSIYDVVHERSGAIWFGTDSGAVRFSGQLTDISGTPIAPPAPHSFQLMQNYPNPFNSKTVIEYRVRERSHIEMTVVNLSGKVVTTLINREITPGRYETVWSPEYLSSGVYFVRLSAVNDAGRMVINTRKILLLK